MSAPPYAHPDQVTFQPPSSGYPPPNAGYPYPPPQNAGYPYGGGSTYPPPTGNYPPPNAGCPPYGNAQQNVAPGSWMAIPSVPVNCPPGLEYLTMIDQLLIHQKVELLEAFIGFETANKYEVKNNLGQKVYYAAEDSDCCTRNCCSSARCFDMKILDNIGNEVIHIYRPLRCSTCWFPCCLQKLEVTAPPGTVIGYVIQEWSICKPIYRIENSAGDCVLRIEGPCCTWSICGDVEFKVLSRDGSTQVGKISKQWSGLVKEAFTDADNFGITFPMDLDVKIKAVLLGACFLIDFMFFERTSGEDGDSPGMC